MHKVYLRADADLQIGFGHFTRTLALADMLKDDFECTFFTQSPTEYQRREVEKVCPLVELPSDDSKFSIFHDLLNGDEIVFLDNYFFTSEYEKAIKDKGCKLVCIGPNDKHYFSDVLINYALTDEYLFDVEPNTILCLGLEWVILRSAFVNQIVNKKDFSKLKKIVLAFGGTDQFFITEKVISCLKQIGDFELTVIATSTFGIERISYLKSQGVIVLMSLTAEEMVNCFKSNDLAILSASTVVQEALSCGIPVCAGYYVNNQVDFYNKITDLNLVFPLDCLLDNNLELSLTRAINNYPYHTTKINIKDTKQRYISLFEKLTND